MTDLLYYPPLLIVAACFMGLCVGSFLNVVVYRLPLMLERRWLQEAAAIRHEPPPEFPKLNLALPRSACPQCDHNLSAVENIPVISYLVLRGRCAHCSAKISFRYPLVEATTGILSVVIALSFGPTLYGAACLVFACALLALSLIDYDTQLLPDDLTLPLVWGSILFNLVTQTIPLSDSVIGAIIGYLSLWSIYWVFKLITGKEGMGYGDFKLLAAIGAFLGWQSLLVVVLIASCAGAIAGISLMLFTGHQRGTPIPFGPYLAFAGVAAIWAGPVANALQRW
ncbi:MAG: prepilin peptidase [Uliginosibacterium sp.]|jgi:leader peptidase (prepilin peptidase)/N-methyltransferase|nr:prepilin peptidase [Uliginosibacterium sp.]